jgi:hypothetical protein
MLVPGTAPRTFGPGGGPHLTVRLDGRQTSLAIARNPRLGLGEAYMDARLSIEDGTILDLLELVVGANRWKRLPRPQGAGARQEQSAAAVPAQSGGQVPAQRR